MTQPLPDAAPGYKWVLQLPDEKKKRRSPWPWIISGLIIVALGAGAWFAGEWLARDIVHRTIRTEIVKALGLPSDQPITVELEGAVLPQLIGGTLNNVHISSKDVEFSSFAGDISLDASGIPVRDEKPFTTADLTVVMDDAQVRTLLSTIEGFPVDSLGFTTGAVTFTSEITVLGNAFPIGVSLDADAAEGKLALTPTALQVAGAELTAEAVRAQFGGLADGVLRTWEVCIADQIPAALTLTDVEVGDGELTALFTVSPNTLYDTELHAPGACA